MEYTLKAEKEKSRQIEELMIEWRNLVERHSSQELADAYGVRNMAELFVSDGFYPFYTEQKRKILFIGRECLGLKDCEDYIEALHYAIKVDKRIGKQSLNSSKFHARMLYTTYGILNGYPEYCNIPYADELADKFACEGGFSYAFMNLSKFSNESEDWKRDDRLIGAFLEAADFRDLFAKEIQILNPDVIIGMNLVGDYGEYMGDFLNKKKFGGNGQVDAYTLHTNKEENFLFLDCYHFSAMYIKADEDLYSPIIEACRNILP